MAGETSPGLRLNGPEGPRGGEAISVSAGDGPTDDDGESEGVVPAEARLGARWVWLFVVDIVSGSDLRDREKRLYKWGMMDNAGSSEGVH